MVLASQPLMLHCVNNVGLHCRGCVGLHCGGVLGYIVGGVLGYIAGAGVELHCGVCWVMLRRVLG